MITRLLISASAMTLAQASFAQSMPPATVTPPSEQPAAPDAADPPVAGSGIADIIVTAQRREENVQRVPVAISVVSAEQFEQRGGVNVANLVALVPSLTFTGGNELRNQSIRIRGLGTDVFSVGVEPSTSTVVDGVVLQRGGQAFTDLADIERIEVLRGPQGTLFGKNSSAGALNIVTNDPTFDRVDGTASAILTEDGDYRLNVAASAPLSETIAVRIAAFGRRFDGNITNLNPAYLGERLNGGDSAGARVKLLWRATDALELKLTGDASFYNATAGALPLIVASTNPIAPVTGARVGLENDQVNLDVSPYVKQRNAGIAFDARLDLGRYTLFFTSAYRSFSNRANSDLDNTQGKVVPSNFSNERSRTFSSELRLVSPTGGLVDYVVGLYQFAGRVEQPIRRVGVNIGALSAINPVTGDVTFRVPGDTYQRLWGDNGPVKTWNYGVFGQANLHPTDGLTITLGGRAIYERQSAFVNNFFPTFFNGSDRPQAPAVVVGDFPRLSTRDGHFIGRAGVSYQVTPRILAYGSYSTGYKGVGWNIAPTLSLAQWLAGPAKPETSRQFEAGLKTRLFDNRVQLNLAAFSTRVKDYQGQAFQPALGFTLLTSIGEVALDGIEAEVQAQLARGWTVSGGATLLDARFLTGSSACYSGQTPANSPRCRFINGVSGTTLQSLDGLPFPNAPDWRVTASSRYEAELGGGMGGYGQVDYRYQSEITFDISNDPRLGQRAYSIFDLSVGLTWENVEFGLFVKNVFDKQYADGKINFNSGFIGTSYAQLIPRDFRRYAGVNARFKF